MKNPTQLIAGIMPVAPPHFGDDVAFSLYIETLAQKNSSSLIKELLDFCDEFDIDYEELSDRLTFSFKDKLLVEAREQNYLTGEMGKIPNCLEFE